MAVKARVKKNVSSSEQFPEGFHRAILVEVEEHDTKNNSAVRLIFANGDLELKEDLWLSEKAQARLTLMTRRLGLIDDSGDEDQEILFDNAVGSEFVIEVKHELDQSDRTVTRLTYGGLWPLDHEDKKVRAFLNTEEGKKPAGAGERQGGGKSESKADDLDDI